MDKEGQNGYPMVAPYTGAWIETTYGEQLIKDGLVAPYTGAWIETLAC